MISEVEAAISVRSVSKAFITKRDRRQALDAVSLVIRRGLITGLVGPNGAGKSTLINCILGLVPIDQGRITIGCCPPEDPRSRLEVGFLPEECHFEPDYSVQDFLRLQERLTLASDGRTWLQALDIVALEISPRTKLRACSHGMRKRIGLAAAILGSPKVLILDEPTAGMDIETKDRVLRFLDAFRSDGGTVFWSSHQLTELESVCDEWVLIDQGRVRVNAPIHGEGNEEVLLSVQEISEASLEPLLTRFGLRAHAVPSGAEIVVPSSRRIGELIVEVERVGGRVVAIRPVGGLEDSYRRRSDEVS